MIYLRLLLKLLEGDKQLLFISTEENEEELRKKYERYLDENECDLDLKWLKLFWKYVLLLYIPYSLYIIRSLLHLAVYYEINSY